MDCLSAEAQQALMKDTASLITSSAVCQRSPHYEMQWRWKAEVAPAFKDGNFKVFLPTALELWQKKVRFQLSDGGSSSSSSAVGGFVQDAWLWWVPSISMMDVAMFGAVVSTAVAPNCHTCLPR